jgi:hypothetical protein
LNEPNEKEPARPTETDKHENAKDNGNNRCDVSKSKTDWMLQYELLHFLSGVWPAQPPHNGVKRDYATHNKYPTDNCYGKWAYLHSA